jgi:hypothetical protein
VVVSGLTASAPIWARAVASMSCGLMVGFALAGCGGSSASSSHTTARVVAKPAPLCLPKAEVALSRLVGVHVSQLTNSPGMGANAEPQCTFKVRLTHGRRLSVIANLDSSPQPYFRLERTAVEATQQFSTTRNIAAPQTIKGLGMDADWYPAQQQLQTTDGVRLITVTVTWHGVSQGRRRALAVAVARLYLRGPQSSSRAH